MASETRERWTAEKIAALPEGPLFSCVDIPVTADNRERGFVMHGGRRINVVVPCRTVRVPVHRDTVAIWLEDDDVKSFVDADGVSWTLNRYADGEYFKRRVG